MHRSSAETSARHGFRSKARAADFLRWWGDQLALWIPIELRRKLFPAQTRINLYYESAGIRVVEHADGLRPRELAYVDSSDLGLCVNAVEACLNGVDPPASVWLSIPCAMSIRPRITLPVAAEKNLAQVLLHEIERRTPFTVDQVAYGARILSRNGASILVELVAVPKKVLQPILRSLDALGLSGADVHDDTRTSLGLNLIAENDRATRLDPLVRLHLVLATVVVAEIALSMAMTIRNRQAAIAELESRVAALREPAEESRRLRNQLISAANGLARFNRTRSEYVPKLELLAQLTEAVPAGAWLQRLKIEPQKLSTTVGGGQVSSVVRALESVGNLENVSLDSKSAISADIVRRGQEIPRRARPS